MLLARMIKEGSLTVSPFVKKPQELLEILLLVDLSINRGKAWVAEGDKNNIMLRPKRGSIQIKPLPNGHYPSRSRFDKVQFQNYTGGVSIDDLFLLEEISVAEDERQVEYRILMHENARKNPRLTVKYNSE